MASGPAGAGLSGLYDADWKPAACRPNSWATAVSISGLNVSAPASWLPTMSF